MTKLKIASSNGTEFYLTKSTFTYRELQIMLEQMKFSNIEITFCTEFPLCKISPSTTNEEVLVNVELKAGKEDFICQKLQ